MAITVRELTEIPHLRTRVFAGSDGLERAVTWAHACELPAPWEWLSGGELVLTTGLGIPEAPAAQQEYVERLAEAGAAGLAIGERMHAPPLSGRMVEAADQLCFPILYTAYEVPFIALEREVAMANEREDQARMAATMRVYDTVRRAAARDADGAALLRDLGAVAGCRLLLVDAVRGRSVLPGLDEATEELRRAVLAVVAARQGPLPAVVRLREPLDDAVVLPVPTPRRDLLVAVAEEGRRPDVTVLQHVATIAALEGEKLNAERERDLRLGGSLLAHLVDRRIVPDAGEQLAERRLAPPFVLAAADAAGEPMELHNRLEQRRTPHLLLQRGDVQFMLLPAATEHVEALLEELGESACVGVSERVTAVERTPEAVREARWALDVARAEGVSVAVHGETNGGSPFLPRSAHDAERAARLVLGPLLDYDAAHESELVHSLETFLAENRSWQRAAVSLHVHKQTLVYRMRRVEELTGRRLDATGDVAELWLALRALAASRAPVSSA